MSDVCGEAVRASSYSASNSAKQFSKSGNGINGYDFYVTPVVLNKFFVSQIKMVFHHIL